MLAPGYLKYMVLKGSTIVLYHIVPVLVEKYLGTQLQTSVANACSLGHLAPPDEPFSNGASHLVGQTKA